MIAEDLGHVTSADIKLLNRFGMLPMRIFQFGFGSEPDSADHLPHNYPMLCAAYTGNHDNNTLSRLVHETSSSTKTKWYRPIQAETCIRFTGTAFAPFRLRSQSGNLSVTGYSGIG